MADQLRRVQLRRVLASAALVAGAAHSLIRLQSRFSPMLPEPTPPGSESSANTMAGLLLSQFPPLAISTTDSAFGFTNGVFGFNVTGPPGSNVVIQASADLQTWIPLQTNLLGSGPLYFSDPQSTTNTRRFYRVQLSPLSMKFFRLTS